MLLVLDASAGIRLAMGEACSALTSAIAQADIVSAPELYDAEVTNVAWKYVTHGDIEQDAGEAILERAMGFVDARVPCRQLAREVLSVAILKGKPSYDLFYVVLARRQAAALATEDQGLRKLAQGLGVKTIGPTARR